MPNHISQTIAIFILILALCLLPFLYRSCTLPHADDIPVSLTSQRNDVYFLQSVGDRLILTSSDGKTTEIPNIDPRTLPPYDQKALANGIQIENNSALEEILQDFS